MTAAAVTNVRSAVYTVPAGQVTLIKRIEVANNSGTLAMELAVDLALPPATARIMKRLALAPLATASYDVWWPVPAGYVLGMQNNIATAARVWLFGAELPAQ